MFLNCGFKVALQGVSSSNNDGFISVFQCLMTVSERRFVGNADGKKTYFFGLE